MLSASQTSAVERLRAQLGRVILGKPQVIEHVLTALLGGGHILMEDVPGVGKTTLAKALALSLSAEFKRIQFTPDLLPSDILGSSVYDPATGQFHFQPGPIFTNVLLADEINRASPRTQSALLEAMSEHQVSIEGTTHVLPGLFLVIATQNPVEFHGTYPLPEAQLDRFALRIDLGYPDREREMDVLFAQIKHHPIDDVAPLAAAADVLQLQHAVRSVRIERALAGYLVDLAQATRAHAQLRLGCSPRGTLALLRMAQARAALQGRDHALPEDVKAVAVPALAHRLTLDTKARYAGRSKEDVVRELLGQVPVGL